MQLKHFSGSLQRETTRLVKSFFNDNPDLLKQYVNGSVAALSVVLTTVNLFMRHLLEVQGLDPNAVIGERDELQQAISTVFEKNHEKDFDEDYDMSWVQKRFLETRGHLKDLNLTKERFMDLTDLSRLPNLGKVEDLTDEPIDNIVQRVNPVAPEAGKREIRLIDEKGLKASLEKLVEVAKSVEKGFTNRASGRSLSDLAFEKRAKAKTAKEATPEFQADVKKRLALATALTSKMIGNSMCDPTKGSRKT